MDQLIGQKPRATGPAASAAPAAPGAIIKDGTQATFMQDVIEASRQVPVLVDFWATWCGPCKTLTPALERVVTAAGGRVRLVKIDIDANRALVQQLSQIGLPLQSVPTVAAFWQGQIADLFQGALPDSELRRFVEALLKMAGGTMPDADLLAEAKAATEANDHALAAELYGAVLSAEPDKPEAWGGMVRALLASGDDEQAREVLAQVPAKLADHPEVAGARSAVALAEEGRAARGQLKKLQARVAADPSDLQARYDLATALNAGGARAEAADTLLDIVRRDREWNDGAARAQLLKFFEAWGNAEPATGAARRKLSAVLFS